GIAKRKSGMASTSAETPGELADSQPAIENYADRTRPILAVLSPILAALAALSVHIFIPDGQNLPRTWMDDVPVIRHPYPIVLQGLFVLSLLLAGLYFAVESTRSWIRYYAPLLAGAMFLVAAEDLLAQKLNWLPWPYFPGPNMILGLSIEDVGVIFDSTWHSLMLLLAGYTIGVSAGVTTGVLIRWFPSCGSCGLPLPKGIGPLPATALVPAVMMLSRESIIPASALIAFAVWFPVTMLTSSGIANVRLSYLDVARTLGAREWYLIFH